MPYITCCWGCKLFFLPPLAKDKGKKLKKDIRLVTLITKLPLHKTSRCPYRAFGRHLRVQWIGRILVSQRCHRVTVCHIYVIPQLSNFVNFLYFLNFVEPRGVTVWYMARVSHLWHSSHMSHISQNNSCAIGHQLCHGSPFRTRFQ